MTSNAWICVMCHLTSNVVGSVHFWRPHQINKTQSIKLRPCLHPTLYSDFPLLLNADAYPLDMMWMFTFALRPSSLPHAPSPQSTAFKHPQFQGNLHDHLNPIVGRHERIVPSPEVKRNVWEANISYHPELLLRVWRENAQNEPGRFRKYPLL